MMTKTILITGATDGIGLETAKLLAHEGHTLLIHGRSETKLNDTLSVLTDIDGVGTIETYRADLSKIPDIKALASTILDKHERLDVLINNAGVFKIANPQTTSGHDARFIVNTVAPYLLTQSLLPLMSSRGRVINLSSAAQASVNLNAMAGPVSLSDSDAYAQSKLAITMWSAHLAALLGQNGPAIIAVNPASFLASKMVREAYGTTGNDLSIGAKILVRAALSDEFANASGKYFDNDHSAFADPHPDALDPAKNKNVVTTIEDLLGS